MRESWAGSRGFDGLPCLFAVFSCIRNPRYSRHSMKMYGDKRSPCWIPRDGLKARSLPLLKSIETKVEEIQSIIMAVRFEGKLKCTRTSLIKLHSRQSKVFSRSILNAIVPYLPLFFSIALWSFNLNIVDL